jgi:diguanylate cyclase (GGDEF)-like protein/PAS domain S-box-containing protein
MDLTDQRIIAYEAQARPRRVGTPPTASSGAVVQAALAATMLPLAAPLLISLPAELLADPDFDPGGLARAAHVFPASAVWMLPAAAPGSLWADVSRHATQLRESGFRIGLDGGVLELSWRDVADVSPSFLTLSEHVADHLEDIALGAVLAGLLAFAGRLGCRVVARGVDTEKDAEALVRIGLFYGLGNYLQGPVVSDATIAADGDQVVRASWFAARSIRALPDADSDADADVAGVPVTFGTSGKSGNELSELAGTGRGRKRPRVQYIATPPRDAVAADDDALAAVVSEAASRFFSAHDPGHVLSMLSEAMSRVVGFDRLAIFEADWTAYALQPRVLVGDELKTIVDVSYPLGTGITGWAFLKGSPYMCGRTADHPEAAPIPGQATEDESMLVVPLTSGNKRIGVVDLWRDGADRFSAEDLQRCVLLAKVAADAWRLAVERAELEQRVVTDTGTGLLNKRWWDELGPREAAQALRSGNGIAILLIDVDGFKSVNDTFGHAIGDIVLGQVARALATAIRSGDAAIRYGGDEFLLMLRDCGAEGALRVAEDVQLAVTSVPGPAATGLSVSIGIALFAGNGETLQDVVGAADAAMYEAKAAGGGQLAFASSVLGRSGAEVTSRAAPAEAEADAVGSQSSALQRGTLVRDVEDQHRALAEAQRIAMIGSFEMDLASGALEWSAELRRVLGVLVDERPSAAGVIDRIHEDDMEGFGGSVSSWIESGTRRYERTFRIVRDDGVIRHVHMRARVRVRPDGRRMLSGTVQDVTERVDSEGARRIAEEQFSLAFEQGAIGMMTQSLDRVITRVNAALCALLGRPAEDIVGKTPDAFSHPDDLAAGQTSLASELYSSHEGRLAVDQRYLRADGDTVYVRCHVTLVRDAAGEPHYVFSQVEDITARRRQEAEIRRLTLEDPLTGLPNRQLLHDRLDRSLRRTRRSEDKVAVVLVGIDNFKRVNDSLGPAAGDRLLMQAARRMADGMRAHDTVARLSGDEFVLLCEGVEDIDHALFLSERLTGLFADPFLLEDDEMHLTVSCGITLATGTEAPEDLLRDAEAAMHLAKERGRARSEVFDESIRTRATGRLDMEAALRQAIERREIRIAFQPIVRLPEETIVGVEALARWNHPVRGAIGPAEFIPIAEDSGLIGLLGEYVLEVALDQVATWRREVRGWTSMYVAVNLSPKQLVASGLLERCLEALERHDLAPQSLRLEVTESTLMDDAEFSTSILRGLSDAGILIAMDDFGTGFSSLSRLKRLPVATLKIDRSFVDGLGSDAGDSSIVHAIVSLGHALNLELCAEGVESALQRDELIRLGCHQAQGYLWSPALPADELETAFGPETGPPRRQTRVLKALRGAGGAAAAPAKRHR